MGPQEIERLFHQSLDDHRLSRGERKTLRQALANAGPSRQQRIELMSKAAAAALEALPQRSQHEVLDWLSEVGKALIASEPPAAKLAEAWFEPHQNCAARIISLLDRSRSDVRICVFTITDNNVSGAILGAHKRGVNVRIITDPDKALDRGSDIVRLQEAGIPVRVDHASDHMHHKFAVFDGDVAVTGSYNWTRGAAERNLENIVVTDDARLVKPFRDEFERLWDVLSLEAR